MGWFKKKDKREPYIGQVWFKNCHDENDPFPPIPDHIIEVEILDKLNGFVRYRWLNTTVNQDQRSPERYFIENYQYKKEFINKRRGRLEKALKELNEQDMS